MALAEWVAKGEPPFDLWPVDIRRFGRVHRDTQWVRERTMEAYGKHYTIAWPSEEMQSCRPTRRSPLYAHLKAAGACFGEKLGWERPNWFADLAAGEKPVDRYSYGRPGWFDAVAREHRAAREAAVLIDQTSFAKFRLKGPGAARDLNRIAAGNVDRAIGSLTYTQMLNRKGGIECDLTVVRLAEDEFYIVTGTGFATHDFDWISRHLTGDCQSTSPPALPSCPSWGHRRGKSCRASPLTILRTTAFASAQRGGFPWRSARCWPCASLTWANWAGSCTSRWSSLSQSMRR